MRVLVCPLDWGLGHATRCIPIIRALLRNGHEVLIAAGGGGRRLLAAEFPSLQVLDFPGYPVRYSRHAATLLPVLLAQLPGLFLGMLKERSRLEALVATHRIDRILSDGRYGVRSRKIPTVFITHQIFIRAPGKLPGSSLAEKLILALNRRLLKGFAEIWVPDLPGEPNLSGDLAHRDAPPPGTRFIGPLSRFHPVERAWKDGPGSKPSGPVVDILASVSGPEPQRSHFESLLRKAMENMEGTRVLILGRPGATPSIPPDIKGGALNVFDHLDGVAMESLFASAAFVVVRSGYTTVMELAGLGTGQVLMVPTPGQSEQEYLADHLDRAGIAQKMDQDALDLTLARSRGGRYRGFKALSLNGTTGQVPALASFIAAHPLFREAGS